MSPEPEHKLATRPAAVVLAKVLGLAMLPVVLVGLLLAFLVTASTAQAPNPFDGGSWWRDRPDTWTDLLVESAASVALSAGALAVLVLALALMNNERFPRRTDWVPPAFAAAVTSAVIAVGVVLTLGSARTTPSCDGFRVDKALMQRPDAGAAYERMLLGARNCTDLVGRPVAEVIALLGPPEGTVSNVIQYGPLVISIEDGRVAYTSITAPSFRIYE